MIRGVEQARRVKEDRRQSARRMRASFFPAQAHRSSDSLTLGKLRSGARRRDATLILRLRTHEATVYYKERLGAFNDMAGRLKL